MKTLLLIFAFFGLTVSGFCQTQTQADTIRTASGLKYVVLQAGTGAAIVKGTKIKAHYTGQLLNGLIFDSSFGAKPIKLTAGVGDVIKGWDEMLLLMRVGEEVEVIIPAPLAYGDRGVADPKDNTRYLIPPGSALKFLIKVLSAH